ncbi:MAG: tyrosine-type recombinase/integrase [Candidatus Obscuribacterales bacterium]|nr:tyrosine-type recombinase/integrase [Candidatus Obscuribacterales bacterium]
MAVKRIGFTIARIEKLSAPVAGKRKDYYDTDVKELLVQVTGNGTKTFYVRRKVDGVSHRIKIGRFPATNVENARKQAREILASIDRGVNPQDKKREQREELTVGQLFELYIEEYAKKRCKTWRDMEENFRRYLSHFADRKLSSIKKTEVQQWVNRLGNKSIHTANRNYDTLRALYSWGIKLGYFDKDNPCKGIDKFKTHARERFLMPDERDRFLAAVRAYPNKTIRDYILVSLGTAARKSNVLAMRWDQIDFTLAQWRIPTTKNDEPLTLGLTEPVLNILRERKEESDSEWVFPSESNRGSASGHLETPNKAFKKILEEADMKDFRIHDLRRTMGSYLAIQGTSMPVIGKALGHKSQAATAVYARLTNDPVRLAMETAQKFLFEGGELDKGGGNVVPIAEGEKAKKSKTAKKKRPKNKK